MTESFHFRLEPIRHARQACVVGYELLAGKTCCPSWNQEQWFAWYASFPDWIHTVFAQIPEHCWLSVNFSSAQIADDRSYATAVTITGQHSQRLVLEWLETSDSGVDLQLVTQRLATLRDLGVRIAIDDLGSVTGMDGLGRAQVAHADFIKLDGLFFQSFRGRQALLRNLVGALQDMGHPCILEWVETEEDQELAVHSGAMGIQGRLFSAHVLHGKSRMGASGCSLVRAVQ